jgi:predicted ATPase/DNA-binding CsgD family transcriptional regulator/Tfp pilus assembly protein PilF
MAPRTRAAPTAPTRHATSFLGRDRELAELDARMDGSRLLTLTGAPGIGKTRIALELARRRRGDAAVAVDLTPFRDPAMVVRALASALGVPEVPGRTLEESVVAQLATQPRLVVLDNCEHLLGACARIAAGLLDGCPRVQILATSRAPLAIPGEHVWEVPRLSLPDETGSTRDPTAGGYDAIDLFVARARVVEPGFALNSFVAGSVADICRRLDGIALAIELAAARVETLTPSEIAARLNHRFALLTHGSPSDAPHHRTLRAALDWSHGLLAAPEQALLRRLSVFAAGFTTESAEAVCSGDELPPCAVAGLLAELVSKSLVVRDGDDRHRLLETIRAYAADRLEAAGEHATLREAHARFELALAERAEPELTGPQQTDWLERLDLEREDLRLAIEWSLSRGRIQWALRLGGALVLFWRVRCHFSEGRELLDAVVSADDGEAPKLRAKALWGDGFLSMMAGDPEHALPLLDEALATFRELGDARGCARALLIIANTRQSYDDPAVPQLLRESAALARSSGDSWCLAHALGVAGFEAMRSSDLATARDLFEESLAVARAARDPQSLRIALLGTGSLMVALGAYGRAQSLLEEALEYARGSGEEYAAGTALLYLGELALGRGEYDRAGEVAQRARSLIPDAGPPGSSLGALLLLGRVAIALEDHAGARRHLDEALRTGHGSLSVMQELAQLAAREGDEFRARELLEEVLVRAQGAGAELTVATAQHGLGWLALATGDHVRAAALHAEALESRHRIGVLPEVCASLEAIAAVAVATERFAEAARLLGAAQQLRARGGYVAAPRESRRREADVARCRKALTSDRLDALAAAGGALSADAAVALAADVARAHGAPSPGWTSLTAREKQVAALVADGLSNPEIGEHLFMSLGTVKTHLTHIFGKLAVSSRTEVAREVWRRQP